MGVSGSGKSTIAKALAGAVGLTFIEGDDVHPPVNKAKMAAGIPLDDSDRAPWLSEIADRMRDELAVGRGVAVACSALKREYRCVLANAAPGLVFVHLSGPLELIASRSQDRDHEYMPLSLLESQFATLEPLGPDEPHLDIDVSQTPDAIVRSIISRLSTLPTSVAAGDGSGVTPQ